MAGQTSRTTPQTTIAYITAEVMPILNKLTLDVNTLTSEVSHIKETTDKRLTEAEKVVDMLRKELYGNGNPSEQPGLKSLVLSVKKWVDDRASIEKAVIIGGVTILLGELATFVFFAVKLATLAQ